MKLKLLARHFKDTSFLWGDKCAIEKALGEILPESIILEQVCNVEIDTVIHSHQYYGVDKFIGDSLKAEEKGFDNSVIRIIDIPTLQEPKTHV